MRINELMQIEHKRKKVKKYNYDFVELIRIFQEHGFVLKNDIDNYTLDYVKNDIVISFDININFNNTKFENLFDEQIKSIIMYANLNTEDREYFERRFVIVENLYSLLRLPENLLNYDKDNHYTDYDKLLKYNINDIIIEL